MRILMNLFLMMCVATPALGAGAKSTLLQTIEVEDRSTDGGEARLYHANMPVLTPCRIVVMLYGESGNAGWVFMFGSRLLSATRTDYDYNRPYYMKGGGKVTSTHSITLRSAKDRKELTGAFAEFKALFDPRKLAQCEQN